ncbi:hypothetical protein [Flexithrix dorotheae]|uniref:hypothetical protein n=1 Tax=Flexithrix dorotheae TaxID=70993 RepID=UPI000364C049|nr:hypothetical protein [Flexithrix dorotheae]
MEDKNKEEFEENKPAAEDEPVKKRKFLKWFSGIIGFIAVLLISLQLIVKYYSSEIIGRILKEVVILKSDNLYSLSYEKAAFSLLEREYEISNLNLAINNSRLAQLKNSGNQPKFLYEFNVPFIELNISDLLDLYFEKELIIEKFLIDNPTIKLRQYISDQHKSNSTPNEKDFFYLISGYLNLFQIDQLEINKGNLYYEQVKNDSIQPLNINDFSIGISTFKIDSTSHQNKGRPFYVDDLYVTLKENDINLPNSPYRINFKDFYLSTSEEKILLDRFNIKNKNPGGDSISLMNIDFPSLEISGLNFPKAYFDSTLVVSKLAVKNPFVSLKGNPNQKSSSQQPFNIEDIYPQISKVFKSFTIEKVEIDSAAVDINLSRRANEKILTNNFSLNLIHFHASADNYRERAKKFYIDDLDFVIRDYATNLPDGLHTLKVREFGISTITSNVYCNNIVILPKNGMNPLYQLQAREKDKLMKIYLSRVEFLGINLWNAIKNKTLSSGRFNIKRPRIEINKYLRVKEKADSLKRLDSLSQGLIDTTTIELPPDSLLIPMDSTLILPDSLLADVTSDSVQLVEADNIQVNPLPVNTQFSQLIEDSISEKTRVKWDSNVMTLPIEEVIVLENNYSYLNLKSISDYLSENMKDSLFPESDSVLLAQEEDYELDSLFLLDQDSLLLASIYPMVSNTFRRINIGQFNLEEGLFSLTEIDSDTLERIKLDDLKINLEKFTLNPLVHLDSAKVLFSDNIEWSFKNFQYYMPDSLHFVQAGEFEFSSRDSLLLARRINFGPISRERSFVRENVETKADIFDLKLNELLLSGFDLKSLVEHQEYSFKNFQIQRPYVTHFTSDERKKVRKDSIPINLETQEPVPAKLVDYIKYLSVKDINVQEGFYSLVKLGNASYNVLNANNISVCGKSLLMDTTAILNDEVKFEVYDLEVFAQNYAFLLPDSVHTVEGKDFSLSLSSSSIYGYNLTIAPLPQYRNRRQTQNYNVSIPKISLEEIDLRRIYDQNELVAKKLTIQNPDGNLKLFEQEKKITKNKGVNLSDLHLKIASVFKLIQIDDISFDQGQLAFSKTNLEGESDYVKINKVQLDINQLKIDSTTRMSNDKIFFTKDINLKFRNYIHQFPDNWHTLRISEAGFSSAKSEIYFSLIHLAPKNWADPNFTSRTEEEQNLFDIYTPEVKLNGIKVFDLMANEHLLINEVSVTKPMIRVVNYNKKEEKETNLLDTLSYRDLFPLFRNIFHQVVVKHFDIDEASIEVTNHDKLSSETYSIDNFYTSVTNFHVDSTLRNVDDRLLNADDVHMAIRDFELDLPDSLNKMKVGEIGISTGKSLIYMDNIDIQPKVDKYAIAEITGHEIDWIHFKGKRFELAGFNIDDFLASGDVKSNQLNFDGFDIFVFRDKRPPFPENRKTKMPQDALRELKTYLKIDTVNIYNSKITYEELSIDGKAPGRIYLDNLNAYGYNFTNDTALLNEGINTQIFANTKLMGEGQLNVAFIFPLNHPNNAFTYQGELEPMDMTALNEMMVNAAGLKINSGDLKSLKFNIRADKEYADGMMRMYYKNLNVQVLKKQPKKEGKIKSFITMFANVVVKSKNPRFLFLKKGKIYHERDPRRSIFNYWAKSALSGVKHSVGFSNEKPPKERRKSVFEFWKIERKGF